MKERLRELRISLNLSQEEFGNRIGLSSRSHISSLEKGARNITDRIITDICREFDVNEDWFRTGEGNMFIELTEMQKVMRYTGLLLKDTDSVIAKAVMDFIVTYEQLDDTSKKVLNEVAQKYLENSKRSKK